MTIQCSQPNPVRYVHVDSRTCNEFSKWQTCSQDIVATIFQFCSLQALLGAYRTCRNWRSVCKRPEVSRALAAKINEHSPYLRSLRFELPSLVANVMANQSLIHATARNMPREVVLCGTDYMGVSPFQIGNPDSGVIAVKDLGQIHVLKDEKLQTFELEDPPADFHLVSLQDPSTFYILEHNGEMYTATITRVRELDAKAKVLNIRSREPLFMICNNKYLLGFDGNGNSYTFSKEHPKKSPLPLRSEDIFYEDFHVSKRFHENMKVATLSDSPPRIAEVPDSISCWTFPYTINAGILYCAHLEKSAIIAIDLASARILTEYPYPEHRINDHIISPLKIEISNGMLYLFENCSRSILIYDLMTKNLLRSVRCMDEIVRRTLTVFSNTLVYVKERKVLKTSF